MPRVDVPAHPECAELGRPSARVEHRLRESAIALLSPDWSGFGELHWQVLDVTKTPARLSRAPGPEGGAYQRRVQCVATVVVTLTDEGTISNQVSPGSKAIILPSDAIN